MTHLGVADRNGATAFARRRHSWVTRVTHAVLAIAVLMQLATALVMTKPKVGEAPDIFFSIHQYGGLVALLFASAFWLLVLFRRRDTEFGELMPWFSRRRRTKLREEIISHLHEVRRLKMPSYNQMSALPSAVHGLGLVLMFTMAFLGAIWFFAELAGIRNNAAVDLAIECHKFLANVVWAYLIGHAGMAIVHHYARSMALSEMWSARRS